MCVCEGDGNAGMGGVVDVIAVSAGCEHMCGTHVVLEMSVVRGMRGVGGVCTIKMCMCLARSGVGGVTGRLGLGFSNPIGTRGVWDVYLCLGGGGFGGSGWVDWSRV